MSFERPSECAIREAWEEAQLEVREDDLELICVKEAPNGKPLYCYLYRTAQLDTSSKMDPDREVDEWKWYSPKDIPRGMSSARNKNRLETVNQAFVKYLELTKASSIQLEGMRKLSQGKEALLEYVQRLKQDKPEEAAKLYRNLYPRADQAQDTELAGVESIDMKKSLKEKLEAVLEKGGKRAQIGEVRTWGGIQYKKHPNKKWIAISGKHKGKEMGKFKEDPQYLDYIKDLKEDIKEAAAEQKKEEKKTPRERATKESKKNKEDYINARKSKYSNLGEDLLGSARHKAMEWKGLLQAEKDGDAERMVNRDFLLSQEPTSFFQDFEKNKNLTPVLASLFLRKFPKAPPLPRVTSTETLDEDKKTMRSLYLDSWNRFKEKLEKISSDPRTNPVDAYYEIRKELSNQIDELRSSYRDEFDPRKSAMSSQLASFYNKMHAKKRKSALFELQELKQLTDFNENRDKYQSNFSAMLMDQEYRRNHTLDLNDNSYKIQSNDTQEVIKKVLEGKTVLSAVSDVLNMDQYGQTSGKKDKKKIKKFSAAELYADTAERVGPNNRLSGDKRQIKFLLEKAKMRGVQWGNSVTDVERKIHLDNVANAFKDLTDTLGLPEEMGSFNGRLGLAIGARGRKGALAHYEPNTRVINLTRKGGVGSLAHEWGHFFDHVLGKTHGQDKYLSENSYSSYMEDSVVKSAIKDLVYSDEWKAYREHVLKSIRDLNKDRTLIKNPQYWLSTREMWARAFERHIDYKLEQQGRKNSYLAGAPKGGLWATDEISAKLAPMFDKIFEEFKNSPYLKKALQLMLKESLIDKLQKGGVGSGIRGHRTNKPVSESIKRLQAEIQKLRDGENLGSTTSSGKPVVSSPEKAKELKYTKKDYEDAVKAHLSRVDRTQATIEKIQKEGGSVPKEAMELKRQHQKRASQLERESGKLSTRKDEIERVNREKAGQARNKGNLEVIKSQTQMGGAFGDPDLDTGAYANSKMAAPSELLEKLRQGMSNFSYGEVPREFGLARGRLHLSMVDDGMYSGYFTRESGDLEDNARIRIDKINLPELTMLIDAKEWDLPENVETPEVPESMGEPEEQMDEVEKFNTGAIPAAFSENAPEQNELEQPQQDRGMMVIQLLNKLLNL